MTTTATKERPILFSAPMVRALLAGTKTQTRRLVKPQPIERNDVDDPSGITRNGWWWTRPNGTGVHSQSTADACMDLVARTPGWWCPYGEPGERLWVRETIAVHGKPCEGQGIGYVLQYRADNAERELDADTSVRPTFDRFPHQKIADEGWKPSIHMPRWACRIVLELTDVRVERLQAISEADARDEGVRAGDAAMVFRDGVHRADMSNTARGAYACLWESINGAGAWEANPYVWALTFNRITP